MFFVQIYKHSTCHQKDGEGKTEDNKGEKEMREKGKEIKLDAY